LNPQDEFDVLFKEKITVPESIIAGFGGNSDPVIITSSALELVDVILSVSEGESLDLRSK